MDSRTHQTLQGAAGLSIAEENKLLQLIKTSMPDTYDQIQRKAKAQGERVFGLVRRGLRGEANCFWAMERGHVVGTPFAATHKVAATVAQTMVQFGCAHVCILAEVPQ